jgi:hypothetical protein
MKMKAVIALTVSAGLLSACQMMNTAPAAGGAPRPAFKDTVAGMATVSSLLVVLELKRQKTQETLKAQRTSDSIAKYQARLTALDAIKGNMVSYSSGTLSLGDRISLVNASSDLAKSKLPEHTDIINMLSTLGQVLMTTQAQMKAGQ